MRLLTPAPYELTYDDVFLLPHRSGITSRLEVDTSTIDGTGTTIPVVVSNMTSVAGRRMAETVARRGAIAVVPQDIPLDVVADVISYVKSRHVLYDTPITLSRHDTVGEALGLLPKRAHGAVLVVEDGRPIGIVTEADCQSVDRFTQLGEVMSRELLTLPDTVDPRAAFDRLQDADRAAEARRPGGAGGLEQKGLAKLVGADFSVQVVLLAVQGQDAGELVEAFHHVVNALVRPVAAHWCAGRHWWGRAGLPPARLGVGGRCAEGEAAGSERGASEQVAPRDVFRGRSGRRHGAVLPFNHGAESA